MSFTITRRQRTLLLFLSASGYAAWFSGLGDRIEAQDLGKTPGATFSSLPQARLPRVASLIVRDPFAGAPTTRRDRSDATSATGSDGVQATATTAGDTNTSDRGAGGASGASETIVPNIDGSSGEETGATARTLVVRATIVGPNPVAYVSSGTLMDIVRIGDTLADRRITKIDLHGLVLSDGTRLDLPDSFVATPRPRAARGGITLNVEDLRRLLAPRPLPAATNRASDGSASGPQPSPTATYPSPGPLPSVNMNGLPVGVNPTSNPSNPTPYPYPYPYAPPGR